MNKPLWIRIQRHLRTRFLSGLLVMVPVGITILILEVLFDLTASFLRPFLNLLLGSRLPSAAIQGISILLFAILIYLVGFVTAHMVGQQMVSVVEALFLKIPGIRSIYGAAKQVVDTFSHSSGTSFREVVLVEFPRAGVKAVGYVTGACADAEGVEQLVVFVPSIPIPTTGFLIIVPARDVEHVAISVEESLKMIVSGGMLIPKGILSDKASVPPAKS